jgi:lipopolysaccharide/colanic/teichoic acid biosynthesis glycosyltransferase
VVLLVIDRLPPFIPPGARGPSVLLLPLGMGCVFAALLARVRGTQTRRAVVVPSFDFDEAYEQQVRSAVTADVSVLRRDRLAALLAEFEPGDYLLVIDAARWPSAGFDVKALHSVPAHCQGAVHALAVGHDPEATREVVDCDESGRVRRVQRLYQARSWTPLPGAMVCFSMVPARAIGDLPLQSLDELRLALSSRGVLTRDVPFASDIVDLTSEPGLLAANERLVVEQVGDSRPNDSTRAAQIRAGDRCRVHTSARLVGPVVLHDRVTIEQGALIVGPAVIGSGCRVRRGAVVIQSVLLPGTEIADGIQVRHRVIGSNLGSAPAAPQDDLIRPPPLEINEPGPDETDTLLPPPSAPPDHHQRVHLAVKRAADVALAGVGLILVSPLLLLIAIVIKIASRGPVLFAHRRELRGGKEFPCWKFRTMVAGAHDLQRDLYRKNEVDGPQFKLRDDPRVTLVGRFLRETNLDELPQLLNVLLGHMSLVGPRPSPFRENQICVPWRRARLSVRPGITGLWQICRDGRNRADFHQWIYYDLMYVRHFSLWLDIKILLATLLTLGGRWRVPLSWMVPTDHPHFEDASAPAAVCPP